MRGRRCCPRASHVAGRCPLATIRHAYPQLRSHTCHMQHWHFISTHPLFPLPAAAGPLQCDSMARAVAGACAHPPFLPLPACTCAWLPRALVACCGVHQVVRVPKFCTAQMAYLLLQRDASQAEPPHGPTVAAAYPAQSTSRVGGSQPSFCGPLNIMPTSCIEQRALTWAAVTVGPAA